MEEISAYRKIRADIYKYLHLTKSYIGLKEQSNMFDPTLKQLDAIHHIYDIITKQISTRAKANQANAKCTLPVDKCVDHICTLIDSTVAQIKSKREQLIKEAKQLEQAMTLLLVSKNYTEGLANAIKVRDLYIRAHGNTHVNVGIGYQNIGHVYCKMKKYQLAKENLLICTDIYQRIQCKFEHPCQMQTYILLEKVYRKQKEYYNAICVDNEIIAIQDVLCGKISKENAAAYSGLASYIF